MAKADLIAKCEELKIPLTGKESVADLEALLAKGGSTEPVTQAQRNADAIAEFGWAVNAIKLNRAKAHVQEDTPSLKGKGFEEAVKARYLELGGLLSENKPVAGGKKGGRVQNMAPNDGSED